MSRGIPLIALLVACGGSESTEPPTPTSVSLGSETRSEGSEERPEPEQAEPEQAELSFDCHGDVRGELARREIMQVQARLRQCYVAPATADLPALRVDVTMRIEPSGEPSRVAATSRTEGDEPFAGADRLRACIENELAELDFGAVEGDCAVVRFPVVFRPSSRDGGG